MAISGGNMIVDVHDRGYWLPHPQILKWQADEEIENGLMDKETGACKAYLRSFGLDQVCLCESEV
jgi:hypothetical protein